MKQLAKPGNNILFFTIQFLNLLFGLSAIALIVLTGWLGNRFGQYAYVNGVYLGLAIIEILLCLAIFAVRKSATYLRLFDFILMTVFSAQLVYILIVYSVGPKIIKVFAQQGQDQAAMLQDLRVVNVYATVVLGIQLLQIIAMSVYCGSIRNRNFDFDFKYMQQNQEIKRMVQQSQYQRQKRDQKMNNGMKQAPKNQKQQ